MNNSRFTAPQALAIAAALPIFLAGFSTSASAQRYLCTKIGANCTVAEEATEDPETPDPTAGNKQYTFWQLGEAPLTTTSDSENSKSFKPDIYTGKSKDRHDKKKRHKRSSDNKPGTLSFSSDHDNERSCAWIPKASLLVDEPETFPLKNKIIRAYYTIKFDSDKEDKKGEGTVLAFLPGSSTTLSSTLCGAGGEYLGFADNGNYTSMPEPRFGIELDIDINSSLSDPGNNHLSIVYNGSKHDGTLAPTCPASSTVNVSSSPYSACWTGDDMKVKKHSSLNSLSAPSYALLDQFPWSDAPINQPVEEIKVADKDKDKEDDDKKDKEDKDKEDKDKDHGWGWGHDKDKYTYYPWLENGSTHGVRVEITASSGNCPSSQIYVKAWVCQSDDKSCNKSSNFKTLGSAYTGSATATVAGCVPFDPNTYEDLVAGFTFGSGDKDTKATYANFAIQTFDP